MEPMTLQELLTATKGTLLGEMQQTDMTVSSVEIDSRSIHENSLFVPLVGERFDGHTFIDKALKAGAAGTLTQHVPETMQPGKFYIQVENTQLALGDLAKYYKSKFPISYIGITGSVGKTTTKDMVAAVLAEKYKVLKTEGNFNNEIGLPLTLLRLNSSHEMCVLEMGMSELGEIEYLSGLVEPDVGIITNIGAAHMETLGSFENILKAKCEIFSHMGAKGLAVLNGDDSRLEKMKGSLQQEIAYYSTGDSTPYQGHNVKNMGDAGVSAEVKTPTESFSVEIPALGSHMIYAVLAATIVAQRYGMTGAEIAAGVKNFVPTKMRMNVVTRGDVTILDDVYNANPQSMRAALEVLAQSKGSYKAAILGDMFELGPLGPSLHHGVGEHAGKLGIDCVVAVGDLAKNIYEAVADSEIPDVFYFKTKEEAKTILPSLVKPGATILVKASRGMEFEELVRELSRVSPGS